jgi:hypothetical protein
VSETLEKIRTVLTKRKKRQGEKEARALHLAQEALQMIREWLLPLQQAGLVYVPEERYEDIAWRHTAIKLRPFFPGYHELEITFHTNEVFGAEGQIDIECHGREHTFLWRDNGWQRRPRRDRTDVIPLDKEFFYEILKEALQIDDDKEEE